MPIDNYIARLKKNGHRITPKVRAVVELFLECGTILDPFEVQSKLQKRFKGLGLPTIYRILESLAGCGILMTATNEDRHLRFSFVGTSKGSIITTLFAASAARSRESICA